MGRLLVMLLFILGSSPVWSESGPDIRVLSNDFVLSGKLARLQRWAGDAGLQLDSRYISGEAEPADLLTGLLMLDTPRPGDLAQMQAFLGDLLEHSDTPWIRVGGGAPAVGNLSPPVAWQLIGYYSNGGEINLRHLFDYWQLHRSGESTASVPPAAPLPAAGFYHPDAPAPFENVRDYLQWGNDRWPEQAPRIGFITHGSSIADAELALLDALIYASEQRGQAPLVFWIDNQSPQALTEVVEPADVRVLVNLTHMQNGTARQAELRQL